MDKIVDHIFAFEWAWVISDFWWTYSAYTQHKASLQQSLKKQEKKEKITAADTLSPEPTTKKLTFQEKHEFEKLGSEISLLEKRVDEINFIFQHQTVWLDDMKKLWKEMDTLVNALGAKETRWLELCERA